MRFFRLAKRCAIVSRIRLRTALATCAVVAVLAPGPAPAQDNPFSLLFGGPASSGRRPLRRHRVRPEQVNAEPTQADVPLPPPRPRFAGDPPPVRSMPDTAASEPPKTSAADADATQAAALPATPPLPPEKPSDLPAPATMPPAAPAEQPPKTAAADADATPASAPQTAALPTTPPLPPEKPSDLPASAKVPSAGTAEQPPKPTTSAPGVAASGATTAFTPRQPAEDQGCFDRLRGLKASFEPTTIGPQPDSRCTVVQPVRLAAMDLPDGSRVEFPDRPTIACATADAFAAYVHDLFAPLVKGSFNAKLAKVWTGPGLECRSRDHIFGAKLSAHGQGLAIDVAQIGFVDGGREEIGLPKNDGESAFETAARAGACGYFHTVLGPGSDSYHRTHWHFDLEQRGRDGDSKYCH